MEKCTNINPDISQKTKIKNVLNLKKDSWFNIFSYIDIQSLLMLESVSKYFRKIFLQYYSEKNTIEFEEEQIKNKKIQPQEKKNNINKNKKNIFPDLFFSGIRNYKKNIIEKNFNFLLEIPYSLIEFCGDFSNRNISKLIKEKNYKLYDFDCVINEINNHTSNECECDINKHIELISANKILVFLNNNLSIYQLNENNIFIKKYYQNFGNKNILFIQIIQNSLFLIDDVGKLLMMNPNNYSSNIKKIRFYIPEEKISKIFFEDNLLIFLTSQNNFYYINFDIIFMKPKLDNELNNYQTTILHNYFPNEDKNTIKFFPEKINKNYNGILDISSNKNSLMFIDNNYDVFLLSRSNNINQYDEIIEISDSSSHSSDNNIYYIEHNEHNPHHNKKHNNKNNNKNKINDDISENNIKISFYKVSDNLKFPDYYKMSFGDNYWILIEQKYRVPLIEWSVDEVMDWFEKDLKYEDYLKVIKYQKIDGKAIIEGDKEFFMNCLGMTRNIIRNLCEKEIKKVENGSVKNLKIWGWGNNKNGNLGILNLKYTKKPIKISAPSNLEEDDFIMNLICSKEITVFITRKKKIYICGNFNLKEKQSLFKMGEEHKGNDNENENRRKNNKNKRKNNANKMDSKKKKNKKGEDEKEDNKDKDLWSEVSEELISIFKEEYYVKFKDFFIRDSIIYITGFKIPKNKYI